MQDTKSNPVAKIEDLRQIPLSFSVVLDKNQVATGYYLLEGGKISSREYTFGQVYVSNNEISFSPLTTDVTPACNMTHLESVTVTFVNNAQVNASCALMKDNSTVALYTSTYNLAEKQQITIQPKFIPDPDAPAVINILDLASIFYGVAEAGKEKDLCAQKKE